MWELLSDMLRDGLVGLVREDIEVKKASKRDREDFDSLLKVGFRAGLWLLCWHGWLLRRTFSRRRLWVAP